VLEGVGEVGGEERRFVLYVRVDGKNSAETVLFEVNRLNSMFNMKG
jgi:hypothetical protein